MTTTIDMTNVSADLATKLGKGACKRVITAATETGWTLTDIKEPKSTTGTLTLTFKRNDILLTVMVWLENNSFYKSTMHHESRPADFRLQNSYDRFIDMKNRLVEMIADEQREAKRSAYEALQAERAEAESLAQSHYTTSEEYERDSYDRKWLQRFAGAEQTMTLDGKRNSLTGIIDVAESFVFAQVMRQYAEWALSMEGKVAEWDGDTAGIDRLHDLKSAVEVVCDAMTTSWDFGKEGIAHIMVKAYKEFRFHFGIGR